MLVEVYRLIDIHHLPKGQIWETDRPSVRLLDWGIYLSVDNIAKIGTLLQNGGKHDGVQLLSKALLAEALYQTDIRGLLTGDSNKFGKTAIT